MFAAVLGAIVVLSIPLLAYRGCDSSRRWEEERARADAEAWHHQLDRIAKGDPDIFLGYAPRGVDAKMRDLQNLEGLTILALEDADITAAGLAHVAAIPNLKQLDLYRCADLTSGDFDKLRGKTSLEELLLVRTPEQTGPIPSLATLPNLTRLTLYQRGATDVTLSEDAVDWLSELRQLHKLELGGAGITPAHLARLRSALPNVEVRHLSMEPTTR